MTGEAQRLVRPLAGLDQGHIFLGMLGLTGWLLAALDQLIPNLFDALGGAGGNGRFNILLPLRQLQQSAEYLCQVFNAVACSKSER